MNLGSYDALLMIAVPACLLAGVLVARLGPYPEFNPPVDHDATSSGVIIGRGQIIDRR